MKPYAVWTPPCPWCGATRIVRLVTGWLLCLACDRTFEQETDASD